MTTTPHASLSLDDLLELRRFVTVAHHVPGRIRLKIDPAVRGHPQAASLVDLVGKGDGAFRARLNILARSLVLEYDPGRMDPGLLTALFTEADADAAAGLARELSGALGLTPQAERR